ncbi:MAG: hypothetical protein GDA48_08555 [Hormoscilla sp. GM102CHS1]|nr:hypothetical protein [Hormoscilla sp. GM102CHS1]
MCELPRNGKIVFLESGDAKSGLEHILRQELEPAYEVSYFSDRRQQLVSHPRELIDNLPPRSRDQVHSPIAKS